MTVPLTLNITELQTSDKPRLGNKRYPLSEFIRILEESVEDSINSGNIDSKNLTLKEILTLVDKSIDTFVSFLCMDCGEDTMDEYYMVHKEIWEVSTHKEERQGILCIGCLEKRLGRSLNKNDFPSDVPLNIANLSPGYRSSDRLRNRMLY